MGWVTSKDSDFHDDLDIDGDYLWIDEEEDIFGGQFNDNDDLNLAMCFSGGYENSIRPLIFLPGLWCNESWSLCKGAIEFILG